MGVAGLPPAVASNRELMELFLPAIKADYYAIDHYTYTAGSSHSIPLITSPSPACLMCVSVGSGRRAAVVSVAGAERGNGRQGGPIGHGGLATARQPRPSLRGDPLPGRALLPQRAQGPRARRHCRPRPCRGQARGGGGRRGKCPLSASRTEDRKLGGGGGTCSADGFCGHPSFSRGEAGNPLSPCSVPVLKQFRLVPRPSVVKITRSTCQF